MSVILGLTAMVVFPAAIAFVSGLVQTVLWLDPDYRFYHKYKHLYKHPSSRYH